MNANRYKVNLVYGGERIYGASAIPGSVLSGEFVEFVNLDPSKCPSVSRRLVDIYAAIAEVLHMIGAGEQIDKVLQDWERIEHLDEKGADIALLEARLR